MPARPSRPQLFLAPSSASVVGWLSESGEKLGPLRERLGAATEEAGGRDGARQQRAGNRERGRSRICLAPLVGGRDGSPELVALAGAWEETSVLVLQPPLHLAARGGYLDCVRELLAWGADRKQRDSSERIPYIVALKRKHGACAALLNPSSAEPLVWPFPLKFVSKLDPDAKALLEAALKDAVVTCFEHRKLENYYFYFSWGQLAPSMPPTLLELVGPAIAKLKECRTSFSPFFICFAWTCDHVLGWLGQPAILLT